jgi:hypothetical protein
MTRRLGICLFAAVLGACCLELIGPRVADRIGFVARVEAVIGRPLTPVSVAGVARRTARRCDAGIYC